MVNAGGTVKGRVEPVLPNTVWLLFWHHMGEGYKTRFYKREERALKAWKQRPGSRLYRTSTLYGQWKEVD
jgi:hypothetical protein